MRERHNRLTIPSSTTVKSPVAITGMGVLSAIGDDLSSVDDSLRSSRLGISKSDAYPELSFPVYCGSLSNPDTVTVSAISQQHTWLSANQLARVLRKAPISIRAATSVAAQAWEHAQLHQTDSDPTRIGLVIAGTNLSQHDQYQHYSRFSQTPDYLSPAYALQMMDTHHVGTLSELLGIQGEGITVGGACASGNVGLLHGLRMLRSGAADICVVVGAMADLSPMALQAFYNIGALGGHHPDLAPNQASRPFDQTHHGFIYGQGAGCMILETTDSAKKRQVPVLGNLLAASQVLDANHLSNPNEDGEARAMRQALAQANLDPSDIDYINTHGSSSPLGDQTELAACQAVFGEHLNDCWLNATKALTGHCLWSAGVIEAIATVLQLNGGYVHGNPNLDDPIDQARFVGKASTAANLTTALSNSFGFGGINTSVILGQAE